MSRESILGRVKKNKPAKIELPEHNLNKLVFDDVLEAFRESLEGVGGMLVKVSSYEEIADRIKQEFPELTKFKSDVKEVPSIEPPEINNPHDCADLEFYMAEGLVAVAENAAIWINEETAEYRSAYFLTQHLSLVIKKDSVVSNMHEAYDRIGKLESVFGTFISGPSKTADIEQSLVLGAHGSRSLIVFVLEN